MCGERTRIFGSLVSNPPMWNGPAVYVIVLAEAVPGASAVMAAIAARTSRWRSFIAGGILRRRVAGPDTVTNASRGPKLRSGQRRDALAGFPDIGIRDRER